MDPPAPPAREPIAMEARREELPFGPITIRDRIVSATLTVVEWSEDLPNSLVLCDGHGFALGERKDIMLASGLNFTAYLQSNYIREIHESERAGGDLDPLIDAAKGHLRAYARRRQIESADTADDVYPYPGEAEGAEEAAARHKFDAVAMNVAACVPAFDETAQEKKRLALSLLRHTLEDGPESVQKILVDALTRPREEQEGLAEPDEEGGAKRPLGT